MNKNETLSQRTNASLTGNQFSFTSLEAYKSARTNMIFAMPGDGCKTILITSSFPKEGKTTTCVNLGVVFAQTDKKVLILDCDLRKPRIHKLFKVNNDVGITDVLVGMKNLNQVIKTDKSSNVDFICCGTVPKTPAELLSSPKMDEILEVLKEKYDYIFLDAPPVMIVSDALVLAPKVSGIFVIARQNYTEKDGLKETINKIKFIGCEPTGVILNGVKHRKSSYNYKNYNRYSYRSNYSSQPTAEKK